MLVLLYIRGFFVVIIPQPQRNHRFEGGVASSCVQGAFLSSRSDNKTHRGEQRMCTRYEVSLMWARRSCPTITRYEVFTSTKYAENISQLHHTPVPLTPLFVVAPSSMFCLCIVPVICASWCDLFLMSYD